MNINSYPNANPTGDNYGVPTDTSRAPVTTPPPAKQYGPPPPPPTVHGPPYPTPGEQVLSRGADTTQTLPRIYQTTRQDLGLRLVKTQESIKVNRGNVTKLEQEVRLLTVPVPWQTSSPGRSLEQAQSELAQALDEHDALFIRAATDVFMFQFLAAAPSAWSAGDWPEDINGAINAFARAATSETVGMGGEQGALQKALQSLSAEDKDRLAALYSTVKSNIRRAPGQQEAMTLIRTLTSKPMAVPISTSLMTVREITRSLGRTPGIGPEDLGMSEEDARLVLARANRSSELELEIDKRRDLWIDYSNVALVQLTNLELVRQQALNPTLYELDIWQTVELGLTQPFFLMAETLEAYSDAIVEPWVGYGVVTGTSPLQMGAMGAIVGAGIGVGFAGVGAVPGAAIGAGAGLLLGAGVGAATLLSARGEVTKQYAEIKRQNPDANEWELSKLAWQTADFNGVVRFTAEVFGDPSNLLGVGLGTKVLKSTPVVGRWLGGFDRGMMKFWDVTAYPMVGGMVGGLVLGPVVGTAGIVAGVVIPAALRGRIPFTLAQTATRTSMEAGTLLHAMAQKHAAATLPGHMGEYMRPTLEHFQQVMAQSVETIIKDPTPAAQTELHRLGLFIYQAGFRPMDAAALKDLSVKLGGTGPLSGVPTKVDLASYNITDALYSNIGKGSFYTTGDIVTRIAAELNVAQKLDQVASTTVQGKKVTYRTVIKAWVDGHQQSAFNRGQKEFFSRKNRDEVKAFESWIDQLRENQLDIMRRPEYAWARSEGIPGSIQLAGDALGRNVAIKFIDKIVYTMSRHYLLFASYGPWNVVETAFRMSLSGVNPFGFLGRDPRTWVGSSTDVSHALQVTAGDLSNMPFQFLPGGGDVVANPVFQATPGKAQEVVRQSGGVKEGWVPLVNKGLPAVLDDWLRLRGAAQWVDEHIPQHFHSIAHWNHMFDRLGTTMQQWYILQKYQQALGDVGPEAFESIQRAVTSVDSHGLEGFVGKPTMTAIRKMVNIVATRGEAGMIEAMKSQPHLLVNSKGTGDLNRLLSHFPELGEVHTRVVLNAFQSGRLRAQSTPEDTLAHVAEFVEGLRASWSEATTIGKVEFSAHTLMRQMEEVIAYSPVDLEDASKYMANVQDLIETVTTTSFDTWNSTMATIDTLTGRGSRDEKIRLAGAQNKFTQSMSDTLDTGSNRVYERLQATLNASGDPAVNYAKINWGAGVTLKVKNEAAFAERKALQTKISGLVDQLPIKVRLAVGSIRMDTKLRKAGKAFQYVEDKGAARLSMASAKSLDNPTLMFRAIGEELVGKMVRFGDYEFFSRAASVIGDEDLVKTLDAGQINLADTGPGMTALRAELSDSFAVWTQKPTKTKPEGLEELWAEVYPKVSPGLSVTPEQKDALARWIAKQERVIDALRRAHEAQDEFHRKVFVAKNSTSYLADRQKVRDAFNLLYQVKSEMVPGMMSIQDTLATHLGVEAQTASIRPPLGDRITPSDVAKLYVSLPTSLLQDLVDPNSLVLRPKEHFVAKHLGQAKHLASQQSQTPDFFGFTEDSLGLVYDDLLRSIQLEPSAASPNLASQQWFSALRDEVHTTLVDGQLHPEAAQAFEEYLTGVAKNMRELPLDKAAWQQTRVDAMEEAKLDFSRDFPDYSNMNMFDSFMRTIYPFWIYEKSRYPWTFRTFSRNPGVMMGWARYMDQSEDGYIDLPGLPGLGDNFQVNPLRGTVFAGGYTGLYKRDYPEYHDLWPATPVKMLDNLSRAGFYPGLSISLPLALFGARKGPSQTGELLPNWTVTAIGAVMQLPVPEDLKSRFREQILPNRFRDWQAIQRTTSLGADGVHIWTKIQRGDDLDVDEAAVWARAMSWVELYSGTLEAQVGIFRYRPQEKTDAYRTLSEIYHSLTGVSPQEQERIRKRLASTGQRFSDIYPLDPLDQWLVQEFIGPDSTMKAWLRTSTAPLLPSTLGVQQVRIQSYYREVDAIWTAAREEGFFTTNEAGNRVRKGISVREAEAQFISGKLKPAAYMKFVGDTLKEASNRSAAIGDSDYYKTVPKSRADRVAFYQKFGIPVPTWSPGQELLWEYYAIKPEVKMDEDGASQYDWETYHAMVDALLEAMNPDIRDRFVARIQAEWTETQKLHWRDSREFLIPYRNLRFATMKLFNAEDQDAIRRFSRADVPERRELQAIELDSGGKLIGQYQTKLRQARDNLRSLDPELDARLLFWGKTTTVKTRQALDIYNDLLDRHRPGARKLTM